MTAAYLNDDVIVKEAQRRLQMSLPIHWEGNSYSAMDAWMTLIGAAADGRLDGRRVPRGTTGAVG
jgi:hypothetical protein